MKSNAWKLPKINVARSATAAVLMSAGLILATAQNVAAHETDLNTSFSHKKLTKQVCSAVSKDHLIKLRVLFREAKVRAREIYAHIECEGKALIEFAALNNAQKIEAYLNKKVDPSSFEKHRQEALKGLDKFNKKLVSAK